MMFACCSWANTYDPLLLRAQASLFPKIVLLDRHLDQKAPDGEVMLTIVSTGADRHVAQQLQKIIEGKYGNSLGNNNMTVTVTTFEDFDPKYLATAYILLQGSEPLFKKVVSHASSNKRIVFSYSYADFKYDSLISLYMKEKTYIYINKSTVKLYGVSFLPVFYKITKILE